jgi:hypothetical protein
MAWKTSLWGQERLVLSPAGLSFAGDALRLEAPSVGDLWVEVFPPPRQDLTVEGKVLEPLPSGGFAHYDVPTLPRTIPLAYRQVKTAGPARVVPMGPLGVAQAPEEADFDAAEVWEVKLPHGCLDEVEDVLLKIDYTGDAARAYLDGRLIADHFYFGPPWTIGLKRFEPGLLEHGLTLKLLPLQHDASIYLDPSARPDFGEAEALVALRSLKLEPLYSQQINIA